MERRIGGDLKLWQFLCHLSCAGVVVCSLLFVVGGGGQDESGKEEEF